MAELLPPEASGDEAIFTADELALLNKATAIRLKMVSDLVGDRIELPSDTGSRIMLGQMLADLDKTTFTKAKLRLANNANKGVTDLKDTVAEALRSFRRQPLRPSEMSLEISDSDYVLDDAVAGEMDQGVILLTAKDLVSK